MMLVIDLILDACLCSHPRATSVGESDVLRPDSSPNRSYPALYRCTRVDQSPVQYVLCQPRKDLYGTQRPDQLEKRDIIERESVKQRHGPGSMSDLVPVFPMAPTARFHPRPFSIVEQLLMKSARSRTAPRVQRRAAIAFNRPSASVTASWGESSPLAARAIMVEITASSIALATTGVVGPGHPS